MAQVGTNLLSHKKAQKNWATEDTSPLLAWRVKRGDREDAEFIKFNHEDTKYFCHELTRIPMAQVGTNLLSHKKAQKNWATEHTEGS